MLAWYGISIPMSHPDPSRSDVSTDPAEWRTPTPTTSSTRSWPCPIARQRSASSATSARSGSCTTSPSAGRSCGCSRRAGRTSEISRATGASTATMTRIAQWLHHGTGGYREALRGAPSPDPEARHDDAPRRATPARSRRRSAISEPGRLRLAVPNKGRLQQPAVQLLHDTGLSFEDGTRALASRVEDFPLDILFVRTDDITEFVADGVADLGITGTNLLIESGAELEVQLELGTATAGWRPRCRSSSAATSLDGLAGLRLATSHPARDAQSRSSASASRGEIVTISGAVEVAPRLGLADGIVDLVSSGSTLVMNGLRSVGPLFASQAVLVGAPAARAPRRRGRWLRSCARCSRRSSRAAA